MRITYLTLIILAFISGELKAQVTQEWLTRYNSVGNGNDIALGMVVDKQGNEYVCGKNDSSSYVTIKYNSSGINQWVRTYTGFTGLRGYVKFIGTDDSGNVYVAGNVGNVSNQNDHPLIIKYNSIGEQIWIIRDDTGNYYDVTGMVTDNTGNIYITGYIAQLFGTYWKTFKYNSSGVLQWSRISNKLEDYNTPISLIVKSGNVYVTGYCTYRFKGTLRYKYVTQKINDLGIQQWTVEYLGINNQNSIATSLAVDQNENVYITGNSYNASGNLDYTTIKYSSEGQEIWVTRSNQQLDTSADKAVIAIDNSDNIYVTGSIVTGSGINLSITKYNSSGDQQWIVIYNGLTNGSDKPLSLKTDDNNNLYVLVLTTDCCGGSVSNVLKFNTSGTLKWETPYFGESGGNVNAFYLGMDTAKNLYVTGTRFYPTSNQDIVTIKYSQIVNIHQINSEIPEKYSLSQNYPNPFNPSTTIKLSLPKTSFVKLKVFDQLGKEVSNLVNQDLSAGNYSFDFNAGSLSSGIYFYKLETPAFSETKRMVLIK